MEKPTQKKTNSASNQKEHIIEVTTELIQQSNGNLSQITSREIAQKAGIGLGLINYHFGSKDQLITECVQNIINNVVTCFSPVLTSNVDTDYSDNFESDCEYMVSDDAVSMELPRTNDKQRLAEVAKQVFDFLYGNRTISHISIVGDMQNYHSESNSVYTQKGFLKSIKGELPEKHKRLLVFMLTCSMQVAFLSGDASIDILGYDLNKKEERDQYIDAVIDILMPTTTDL